MEQIWKSPEYKVEFEFNILNYKNIKILKSHNPHQTHETRSK